MKPNNSAIYSPGAVSLQQTAQVALGVGKFSCSARSSRDSLRLLGGLRLSSAQSLHQKRQNESCEARDCQQQIT
ncbi:unnamed protein product [Callosobruchus maculatus]|uniref:Uncharacterized protein n=1 Tax=Callosobruchus maculatus TaxID=64391 RepID=A0A653C4X4_CALMS|nr:unnamed protein product [Callosobruchus maculatus]